MKNSEMAKLASMLVNCSDDVVGAELLDEMLGHWPEMLPFVEREWARPFDDGSGSLMGIYGGKSWAETHGHPGCMLEEGT